MSVVPMFAHKSLSLFFSLLSLSGAAIAIETSDNKTEIVHILADRMTFNLESDTSVYNGNVSIKQGAMALSGDRIEIERKDNAIIKMIAKGNPAKYHQLGSDGTDVEAQSQRIQYFADKNRLVMIDQARLAQDSQIIESERIVYDTEKQTLIAGQHSKQADSSKRVKITLTPNNNP